MFIRFLFKQISVILVRQQQITSSGLIVILLKHGMNNFFHLFVLLIHCRANSAVGLLLH